jgi:hypothetical protein
MMNYIIKKLDQISVLLDENKLAVEGARYMQSITPIRTGNARNKTYSRNNEIHADYPYAKRLDEGWSQQNQTGLIDPTIQHLEDLIKRGAI